MSDGCKKIGLVLGAGGSRGMCHLGVLKAFEENGIGVHCVSGSSMGAIAGGLFAAGVPYAEMERLSRMAKQSFVMDLNIDLKKGPAGIFGAKRVMKMLNQVLGDLRVEDCKIPFRAAAVDVETGELVIFDKGVLKDVIRASMAIPITFTPWNIDGRLYIDGGVLCRLPIDSAREMGADIVIAVDALGPLRKTPAPKSLFGMIERYSDINNWEITKDKISAADILIIPDMGNKSQFMFKNNDKAVEAGYRAAMDAMPDILKTVGK